MSVKKSKVVIVGAGNVGSTTAYTMLNQGLCEELVLLDMNQQKAEGEVMDMQHSVYFMNRNIKIHTGDYTECRDADYRSGPYGSKCDYPAGAAGTQQKGHEKHRRFHYGKRL